MRAKFYGLQFDIPDGWADVTDDVHGSALPTMARPDGVGAIQFSIGRYKGGKRPEFKVRDLEELLEDFCRKNSLVAERASNLVLNEMMSASICSRTTDETICASYISNGTDVVLATYTCEAPFDRKAQKEIQDFDGVVSSIYF